MAESSVLGFSGEGVMQVSSVCWVGVRIGLYSGGFMPKIRPIRPGAGEYQGARAVSDRLSWRWLIRLTDQIK